MDGFLMDTIKMRKLVGQRQRDGEISNCEKIARHATGHVASPVRIFQIIIVCQARQHHDQLKQNQECESDSLSSYLQKPCLSHR